jgi:hypothetical protein
MLNILFKNCKGKFLRLRYVELKRKKRFFFFASNCSENRQILYQEKNTLYRQIDQAKYTS